MEVILVGIFVAVALIILGQKFPQIQPCRWMIFFPVILAAVLFSTVKIVPPGHMGVLKTAALEGNRGHLAPGQILESQSGDHRWRG